MEYKERIRQRYKEQKKQLDKEAEIKKQRKKDLKYRKAFNKLPSNTDTEFWCDKCNKDLVAPAYKVWLDIYSIGIWRSNCPFCTLPIYRNITQKALDPYYEKSLKIKIMREDSYNDFLRPKMYGFKTLYGDPFEEYYSRYQKQEEFIRDKYASLGLKGTTLKERTEKEKLKEAFDI